MNTYFAILATLALAACGPVNAPDGSPNDVTVGDAIDVAPMDVNVDCSAEFTPRRADAGVPTFGEVQGLFTRRCTAGSICHGAAGGLGGLVLEGPGTYAALVGHRSVTVPYLLRVEPGSPEHSFLWMKLDGCFTQLPDCVGPNLPCGEIMPKTSPISEGFSLSEAAALHDWIRAGAPQN